ncbi:hypothetical protein [Hirschia baltica]|uniref:Uncharacterized protein n=1 Tax=Hirschia baltica (strain ATCC 49814 / DSM 5838 / IFAM 1418) TaxID=582402 RepID=C6XN28_HIRBI|nr:hypothetical protein [Hirschia baltica]ACT58198.1 hypothetical protein Hbal_0496 [Hirschia baltica ATCC 49814]
MLGLLILVRDSLLVLLMSWAGLDVTPEKQDDSNKPQASASAQRLF